MQLPDFTKAKVLVVGDVMLDRYWTGGTSRISPEAPVPVVNVNNIEDRPGGAANVALNLATLGCSVGLMGITGKDESANILKTQLSSMKINCEFCEVEAVDTITKLRVMSRNQQLIRLDFEKLIPWAFSDVLTTKFHQLLDDYDVILFSDYAKGTLQNIETLIHSAQQQGKITIVDPKGSEFSKYRGSTLLTPNFSEFQDIVGQCETEEEVIDKAQSLIQELSLGALLITRSERGMTLLQPNQPEFHLPAKAKEVYDVTGAGDTVIATVAASLAANTSMEVACQLANGAASIVVGKLGTSTINADELAQVAKEETTISTGVMNVEQLKIALIAAKSRGENIIMTNGCFDILHSGHVGYLQTAKALGDRLIVAVNDDPSVSRLKGAGRPVNNIERRMSVLAALSSVDWVISFSEDTPKELISDLLPDILVKGGDYKIEEIAGGKQVIENGGQVKVLGFEDGISTSKIIDKLNQ